MDLAFIKSVLLVAPVIVAPLAHADGSGVDFRIGAIGDSISRAYDLKAFNVQSTTYSWTTGDDLPASHANRFRDLFQSQGVSINVGEDNNALVGDRILGSSSHFQKQVQEIISQAPDYVTLMIGANDVCQGELIPDGAVEQFKEGLISALNSIKNSAHPPKVIALVSIPHILRLTQIPDFSNHQGCRNFWAIACSNLSKSGADAFEAQWQAANAAIAAAAAAVGEPVVYDQGDVANTSFTPDEVSKVDCFHPSEAGQTKISDVVWNRVQPAVTRAFRFQATPAP